MDLQRYEPQIEEILREVVSAGKALEINTSGAGDGYLTPDERIVDRYLSLGGTRFTLGSDAHRPADIARGLDAGARMLRQKGVKELCLYRNRKEFRVSL